MLFFSIVGETGVSKTRLVYESLKNQQLDGLILYYDDDEHAKSLSNVIFVNSDTRCKVVLIADECSVACRELMRRRLNGVKDRVRVIAIETSGLAGSSMTPDRKVTRPSGQQIELIFNKNRSGSCYPFAL